MPKATRAKEGLAFALSAGVLRECLFALACLALPLAACMPYSPGSFKAGSVDFPDTQASRGCLDIGISASSDSQADGPVLDIYLGNRCDEGVWVDLSALEVSVLLPTGHKRLVSLYDPREELHAAVLGGRELVRERIEVQAPFDSVLLCAHFDRFSAVASGGPPQVLCTEVQGV